MVFRIVVLVLIGMGLLGLGLLAVETIGRIRRVTRAMALLRSAVDPQIARIAIEVQTLGSARRAGAGTRDGHPGGPSERVARAYD